MVFKNQTRKTISLDSCGIKNNSRNYQLSSEELLNKNY